MNDIKVVEAELKKLNTSIQRLSIDKENYTNQLEECISELDKIGMYFTDEDSISDIVSTLEARMEEEKVKYAKLLTESEELLKSINDPN